MRGKLRLFILMAAVAFPALASLAPASAALAASAAGNWTSPSTYTIDYLGRDGPGGTDHYWVQVGWGATFFGIAVDAMPLVPAEQAVSILTGGYEAAYPGRPIQDLRPGDSFAFFVPAGTVVSVQWRKEGNVQEYRSLRGDDLSMYTGANSPISYRLVQAGNPGQEQVKLGDTLNLTPYQLAASVFGQGAQDYKPDFIQVWQAQQALQSGTTTLTIDSSGGHLDSFQDIKAGARPGGKNAEGLNTYWISSASGSQDLFRVDDGIGNNTDVAGFPSIVRVYYYRDGSVRVYEKSSDPGFLSTQNPMNAEWAQVFTNYGQANPTPTQWGVGQPEQGATAQELSKMGIEVLRFQPQQQFQGNNFTQMLDWIFSLMQRKTQGASSSSSFGLGSVARWLLQLGSSATAPGV